MSNHQLYSCDVDSGVSYFNINTQAGLVCYNGNADINNEVDTSIENGCNGEANITVDLVSDTLTAKMLESAITQFVDDIYNNLQSYKSFSYNINKSEDTNEQLLEVIDGITTESVLLPYLYLDLQHTYQTSGTSENGLAHCSLKAMGSFDSGSDIDFFAELGLTLSGVMQVNDSVAAPEEGIATDGNDSIAPDTVNMDIDIDNNNSDSVASEGTFDIAIEDSYYF